MEATEYNTEVSGINVHGTVIRDLRLADNVNLLTEKEGDLKKLVDKLYTSSRDFGLQINRSKSKVMVFEWRSTNLPFISLGIYLPRKSSNKHQQL